MSRNYRNNSFIKQNRSSLSHYAIRGRKSRNFPIKRPFLHQAKCSTIIVLAVHHRNSGKHAVNRVIFLSQLKTLRHRHISGNLSKWTPWTGEPNHCVTMTPLKSRCHTGNDKMKVNFRFNQGSMSIESSWEDELKWTETGSVVYKPCLWVPSTMCLSIRHYFHKIPVAEIIPSSSKMEKEIIFFFLLINIRIFIHCQR